MTEALSGPISHLDSGCDGISVERVFAAAIVGGTASELSGGKFTNGAITGAFSQAFNDEAHALKGRQVLITRDDSSTQLRTGGDPNWRNNNPGNMRAGSGDYQPIGHAGGFAIFANYQTGYDAMIDELGSDRYQVDKSGNPQTIAGAIATWAPSRDQNDPVTYANHVAQWTGLPANTLMNSLTSTQMTSVADAIQRQEGTNQGTVVDTPAPSRLLKYIPNFTRRFFGEAAIGFV